MVINVLFAVEMVVAVVVNGVNMFVVVVVVVVLQQACELVVVVEMIAEDSQRLCYYYADQVQLVQLDVVVSDLHVPHNQKCIQKDFFL